MPRKILECTTNASPSKSKLSSKWDAARKVAFSSVYVTVSGRRQKRRRIDVLLEALANSTRRKGDTDAVRQHSRMRGYLERRGILHAASVVSEGKAAMRDRMARQDRLSKIGISFGSLALALVERCLQKDHLAKYGTPLLSRCSSLEPLDLERGEETLRKARTASAKAARAGQGGGYANPPLESRWTKGQSGNPSGRKKQQDDGWATFRAEVSKSVAVRIEGQAKKLSSDEVVCIQLFDAACTGDRSARKLVCDLLIELDQRDLLTPPQARTRRKKPSPEALLLFQRTSETVLSLYVLHVKSLREADFEAVYGADPEFQLKIDQERRVLVASLREVLANKEPSHEQG